MVFVFDEQECSRARGPQEGGRGESARLPQEEADPNPALIAHPRCVVTPHSGWDSVESYVQLRQMAVEPMREYLLTGRIPSTCVNPPLA